MIQHKTGARLVISMLVVLLLLVSCAQVTAPSPSSKPPSTQEATAKSAPSPAPAAATPKPATNEPRSGDILNIAHFGDPISYDPIQENSVQSQSPLAPNYSAIVQHDPLEPTKVIGDLAEKWDVGPDGLTYTFQLHKNATWHDGTPFTSEDARFTLETVRKPPRGITSPRQEWLKAVDKIEAPAKDTLKMALLYPSASFLDNLGDGRMLIVPKHVFEAKGNMKRDIVGTGPFKFKSFAPGVSFNVVKNPDYFVKGRPYIDGITWYIIQDSATRFAALRTHRVQATPLASQGLTASQAEALRKEMSDRVSVHKYPSLTFAAFWMPHSKGPWNDIRVRRAVEIAIDRQKIIKVSDEGVADFAASFMPSGAWSLPEQELRKLPGWREPKDADIAEARRLLAEAGYAQGIKTTTLARNVPQYERAALSLKEQLAQIGIELAINLKDTATMFDLLYKRSYDTAVFSGSSSYDDPDQVFGAHFTTGAPRNVSDFSDAQIDKWCDEQSRTLDTTKRKEIVLNMQLRMFELIPASMIRWGSYELGHWNEVKDYRPGIGVYNNLKFQSVWLAK